MTIAGNLTSKDLSQLPTSHINMPTTMNANGDSKISSVLLFLLSYPFANKVNKKLNAVGISSLPAAIKTYRTISADDIKKDVKRKMYAYLVSLFHSSAVISGLFGRYPRLIQAHAIVGIGAAVKDSILLRRQKEEEARLEAERRAAEKARGGSMTRWVKGWMFGSSPSSVGDNDDTSSHDGNAEDDAKGDQDGSSESEVNQQAISSSQTQVQDGLLDSASRKEEKKNLRKRFGFGKKKDETKSEVVTPSPAPSTTKSQPEKKKTPKPKGYKTAKAQSAVKRTKSIIKGKRDSATDDIIWGVFQSSFVLLDQTIGKALAYAWLLFLLTILEEAILNPKLNKEQRMKRLGWIVITGYFSGRLVLPDWNAIAGENTT